jgi:hypothetical protein
MMTTNTQQIEARKPRTDREQIAAIATPDAATKVQCRNHNATIRRR